MKSINLRKKCSWLTDYRIFGVLTTDFLDDFFIKEKVKEMREKVNSGKGKTLVIGVGAMYFNMRYTQDESCYIPDTESSDAGVYLGVKKEIVPEEFIDALNNNTQETGEMDVEKFVNRFPAKKHDYFLIPGGTIHCSGKNIMVLEISSTQYIFTFKL